MRIQMGVSGRGTESLAVFLSRLINARLPETLSHSPPSQWPNWNSELGAVTTIKQKSMPHGVRSLPLAFWRLTLATAPRSTARFGTLWSLSAKGLVLWILLSLLTHLLWEQSW